MVLIFIDESGTISFNDPDNIFILNAILMEEVDFIKFETNITIFREKICNTYQIPNKNFEIHMAQLTTKKGKRIFGKILSDEELTQIYQEIYNTLIPNNKFKIISIVALKDKVPQGTIENQILRWSLDDLLERIEYCLSEEYKSFGNLLMDTNDINSCAKIRKMVKDILSSGTYHKKTFKQIPHFIHFLDSASNNGIQLSDAVGYSIRRFLRKKIYGLEANIDQYNDIIFKTLIKPKFRNYPNCLGVGLKIYPNIRIGI